MEDTGVTRQKPIGGTIGLVFAGLWSLLGALALPPGWQTLPAIAGFAISALLIALSWRRSTSGETSPTIFGRRGYVAAVLFEVLAIAIATNLLRAHGLQSYLLCTVGVIVGLHFVGLWQATLMRHFLAIAVAMCAVSVLSALLPVDVLNFRDVACGFGNALVLWIGANRRA